jgi:hypothetical protein
MTIITKGMGAILKKIRPGGDRRGLPITTSKGSVIQNPQDKFSKKALKKSQYQQDLKRFNEGISDYDPRKGKK